MKQLHKQFSDEEVKQYLKWYEDRVMTKSEVLDLLGIKDSRFYALLAKYRNKPKEFSVAYNRVKATRHLPPKVVKQIRRELETERGFVTNPNMPIMFYNYSAIRDAVEEDTGHDLSAQTVINYAKRWGFYLERPKRKAHTREVLTDSVGMLLQHDASIHQWSPYVFRPDGKPLKWSLITTLDDHSRKMLYADLFEHESAWAHIQSLESVVLNHGVGIQYYSDNHAIFRYVVNRDTLSAANYRNILGTDDIAPQWKQCVEATGMRVTYALSPEAKGKIERPYRWLQDRIVRRSAREHARTLEDVRHILFQEVDRYNNRAVHSTTGEIPSIRFNNAVNDGRTAFKPLDIDRTKPPVTSTKDLFCLRTERKVNGYGKISLNSIQISVPGNLPDGAPVTLHIVPGQPTTEVRFLRNNIVLGYQQIPTPKQLQF
jgi:transposase